MTLISSLFTHSLEFTLVVNVKGQTKFQALRDNTRQLEIELATQSKQLQELKDLPDQIKEAHEAVARMKQEKESYSQKVGKELGVLDNVKQELIATNTELNEVTAKYEMLQKLHELELKRFMEFELLQEEIIQESTRIKVKIFHIISNSSLLFSFAE